MIIYHFTPAFHTFRIRRLHGILFCSLLLSVILFLPFGCIRASAKNNKNPDSWTLSEIAQESNRALITLQKEGHLPAGSRVVILTSLRDIKSRPCQSAASENFRQIFAEILTNKGPRISLIPRGNLLQINDEISYFSSATDEDRLLERLMDSRMADFLFVSEFQRIDSSLVLEVKFISVNKVEQLWSKRFPLVKENYQDAFRPILCDCQRLCNRGEDVLLRGRLFDKLEEEKTPFSEQNDFILLDDCTNYIPLKPGFSSNGFSLDYIKLICNKTGGRLPTKDELETIRPCLSLGSRIEKIPCLERGDVFLCVIKNDKVELDYISHNWWDKFSMFRCVFEAK